MSYQDELVCLGARLGNVCSVRKSCQHYRRLRESVGKGMRLFQLPELGEDCRHYSPVHSDSCCCNDCTPDSEVPA